MNEEHTGQLPSPTYRFDEAGVDVAPNRVRERPIMSTFSRLH
jgi:hypothetical protein